MIPFTERLLKTVLKKKCKEADALSRVGHNASLATILHLSSTLMTEVTESWKTNPKLHKLVDRLAQQPYKQYTFDGTLFEKKR